MESLYSKLEASLKSKEIKTKEMSDKLTKKAAELDEQTKKVTSLQMELVKLSEHIPRLTNYSMMEEQYKYAVERNAMLEQKCESLEKEAEEF